jgi:hypothetical protein
VNKAEPPPNQIGYSFVLVQGDQEIPLSVASVESEVNQFNGQEVTIIGKLTRPVDEGLAGPEELIYVRQLKSNCE